MTTKLTDKNFKEKTKEGNWVIDCWASWCGPCQMFGPIFEEADKEVDSVNFGKLNVDENKETAGKFGVMSIPTVLYMKDGEVVDKSMGALPKEQLISKINSVFE